MLNRLPLIMQLFFRGISIMYRQPHRERMMGHKEHYQYDSYEIGDPTKKGIFFSFLTAGADIASDIASSPLRTLR